MLSAVGVWVGAVQELWAIVVALVVGWLRVPLLLRRARRDHLGPLLLQAASHEGWREPGWAGEDELVERLVVVADGSTGLLRAVRREVDGWGAGLGARAVALDRLDLAIRVTEARRRRRVARAATVLAWPTVGAVAMGLLVAVGLSDVTPGPVLAAPWNAAAAVVAAVVTTAAGIVHAELAER